jgi:hypothetical protein
MNKFKEHFNFMLKEMTSKKIALLRQGFEGHTSLYNSFNICQSFEKYGLPYEAPQERSMAGAEGFEPPIIGPKPIALPLGHAPNKNVKTIYYYSSSTEG